MRLKPCSSTTGSYLFTERAGGGAVLFYCVLQSDPCFKADRMQRVRLVHKMYENDPSVQCKRVRLCSRHCGDQLRLVRGIFRG